MAFEDDPIRSASAPRHFAPDADIIHYSPQGLVIATADLRVSLNPEYDIDVRKRVTVYVGQALSDYSEYAHRQQKDTIFRPMYGPDFGEPINFISSEFFIIMRALRYNKSKPEQEMRKMVSDGLDHFYQMKFGPMISVKPSSYVKAWEATREAEQASPAAPDPYRGGSV